MLRIARHMVGVAAFSLCASLSYTAWAVSPNPLENAYWRFEEGTAGTPVAGGTADTVLDSINANHMHAFNSGTAPLYSASAVPTPLKSGRVNNLALTFSQNDDLFTDNKNINNGMIGPPVAPNVSGFTLEAAFRPTSLGSFQGI